MIFIAVGFGFVLGVLLIAYLGIMSLIWWKEEGYFSQDGLGAKLRSWTRFMVTAPFQ